MSDQDGLIQTYIGRTHFAKQYQHAPFNLSHYTLHVIGGGASAL